MTVVLVSHDLNLASQYCDRILMLKAGALFRLGTPHEVIDVDVSAEPFMDATSWSIVIQNRGTQGHDAQIIFQRRISEIVCNGKGSCPIPRLSFRAHCYSTGRSA